MLEGLPATSTSDTYPFFLEATSSDESDHRAGFTIGDAILGGFVGEALIPPFEIKVDDFIVSVILVRPIKYSAIRMRIP